MSFNLNRVMLAGNLTRDPEVRHIGTSQVANFGLAMNRRWTDKDGAKKEEVTFVDVECWGRTAELVAQYMTKGRPCYIDGRLKLDTWETRDGQKRQSIKVVADSVQFLGQRPADGGATHDPDSPVRMAAATMAGGASKPAAADTDEPPF